MLHLRVGYAFFVCGIAAQGCRPALEPRSGNTGAFTGLYCATDQLTVGKTTLFAEKPTGVERHKGDKCLHVVSGTLNIHVSDAEGQAWFELNPRDGFYIPAGIDHQYDNMSGEQVEFVFGVAPDY